MNISEAAAATELSIDTIRYYDRIGILGPVARTGTGARDFVEGDLGWLRILRCLRGTGMTMADLRRFCAADGDLAPGRQRAILEEHRTAVLERLARTHRELEVIDGKIAGHGGRRLDLDPADPAVGRLDDDIDLAAVMGPVVRQRDRIATERLLPDQLVDK